MNTTRLRWLTTYLLIVPAITVGLAIAAATYADYSPSAILFFLSFVGGFAVVIGFSGVITANEKFEAAGSTGVLNLDSELLEDDTEMDYPDRAGFAFWGVGVFILSWIGMAAITLTA